MHTDYFKLLKLAFSRSTDVTSTDLVSAMGKTKEVYCCDNSFGRSILMFLMREGLQCRNSILKHCLMKLWNDINQLPKLGQLSGCDVSWPRECCYRKSEQFSLAYDLHRPTLHLHTFLLPTVQVASAQLQIVDCHVSCHHHQRAARGHSLHLANNNQTTLICIHNMQYTGRIHACLFNEVTGHIPPDITPQGQSPPFSGKAG